MNYAGTGSDRVDGGTGRDVVSFADLTQGVGVNLRSGTADSERDTDTLINVENITGLIYG